MKEVARAHGVSKNWVSKLVARYRAEGEAAFEPRLRRPKTSPNSIDADTLELIVRLRKTARRPGTGRRPGHHRPAPATAPSADGVADHDQPPSHSSRPGARAEEAAPLVLHPLPSSAAERDWQADFTADGTDTKILSWLDDHSRYALGDRAHPRHPIVRDTFRRAVADHGVPASTLTDNGMVFTTRLAGGRGGRNAFDTTKPPNP
ncbi:leucine zipper domain-containing protein [Nonomuraea deserti]|uniref:leucine zipper domain-containing protein n=1 Tax=Nonomuraea deserti TaxID=1848322 RepID=UPI00140516DE|nr:leucine zipper domain-containing protein [Nonomuraea deserti]